MACLRRGGGFRGGEVASEATGRDGGEKVVFHIHGEVVKFMSYLN
jgi:hypothetical protein